MVFGSWGVVSIFISSVTCPYKNLAFENHLLHSIDQPTLFLYVNAPAVVMGRAQNPWQEANLSFLATQNIPLLRRQSGGGTVVHDLGNLNFCFLSPPGLYDKKRNLAIVLQALKAYGVEAEITPHYDLMVAGLKVSGSAFRETRRACFHHGTLLIHSNLSMLREALRVEARQISSGSIPSRRSAVTNLVSLNADIHIQGIQALLFQHFSACYPQIQAVEEVGESRFLLESIQKEIALYQSEAWIYGRCLPFSETLSIKNKVLTLQIEGGKIVDYTTQSSNMNWLLGLDYRDFDRMRSLGSFPD